jgi:GT2 family glycosyltransferase
MDLSVISRNPTRLSDATTALVMSSAPPRADLGAPRTSIILVTHNNLVFTRIALHALLAHTTDCEIIVIDNASTDGTREYLQALPIRVIANNENRGFPAANNQGLSIAQGETVVLLNNDTIVPRGWLPRLIEHLKDDSIGSLCACTNRIGNEAEIDTSYRTFGELCDFAQARLRQHAGEIFDIPMAPMFCLAMRREVYEKVGPLDEQFGAGMFEDDDYAMRVRAAGYRVCCADDVFVHHFGGASFGNLIASGEHGQLFRANRERFEKKWGVTWRSHGGRRKPDYDQMLDAIRAAVTNTIRKGSTIAVINKGDNELLKLEGMRGLHFPRQDDGQYSGHYPADADAAIAHLEEQRDKGAEYLLVPRTSSWWLEHYPQFAEHLEGKYRRVALDNDSCVLFDLSEIAPKQVAEESEIDRHIREFSASILPPGAQVLIVGKWKGRTLEALSDAEYLVVPQTHLAWLDQYPALRDHLNNNCRLIADRRHVARIYGLTS